MTTPGDKRKLSSIERLLQKERMTESDLRAVLRSAKKKQGRTKKLSLSGKSFKYVAFSDPHVGHKQFKDERFDHMLNYIRKEKPDFVVAGGDHVEGMSNRAGHVYELEDVGFEAQVGHVVDLYNEIPVDIFGIDGNHDGWYIKAGNAGIIVGEALEKRVKNYTHLGEMEGDIQAGPVHLKVFHPGDGSAYAISYKLQKLVESFTGGEKPHIVMEGHYHKALYMFNRNVHGFELGTLCGQSQWMRGKKLPAHMGFWGVEVFHDKDGVNRIKNEFIPFYK